MRDRRRPLDKINVVLIGSFISMVVLIISLTIAAFIYRGVL